MLRRVLQWASDLVPVFLVAVAVAFASTLAGSVLDHVHQVDAEELVSSTSLAATDIAAGTQTVTVNRWGVQITLPLAPELPQVSYADQAGASLGFSAADIARLGPVCSAAHDALGTIIRVPHGSADLITRGPRISYVVATVAGNDYIYQLPQNACADTPAGHTMVNRETSIIREALGSLAPIQP